MRLVDPKEMKAVRMKAKMTQMEFAEELGYKWKETICRKETGKLPITMQDTMIIRLLL